MSKIKPPICTIIDFHPWVCTERTVSILRGVATDFGVPIEPTFSADLYVTHEYSQKNRLHDVLRNMKPSLCKKVPILLFQFPIGL